MKLINIAIKSITERRLKKLFIWNNDQKITKFFKSKSKTIEQIKKGLAYPGTYHFMINESHKDIGYIFITKKEKYAYLTIMIDKKYWGKGYGKQAMLLIEDEVRKLKINKTVLGLYKENGRALKLYQSLGYIQTKEENTLVMEKNL